MANRDHDQPVDKPIASLLGSETSEDREGNAPRLDNNDLSIRQLAGVRAGMDPGLANRPAADVDLEAGAPLDKHGFSIRQPVTEVYKHTQSDNGYGRIPIGAAGFGEKGLASAKYYKQQLQPQHGKQPEEGYATSGFSGTDHWNRPKSLLKDSNYGRKENPLKYHDEKVKQEKSRHNHKRPHPPPLPHRADGDQSAPLLTSSMTSSTMYGDMNAIKLQATFIARVTAAVLWLMNCYAWLHFSWNYMATIEVGGIVMFGQVWVAEQMEAVWLTLLLIATPYAVLCRNGKSCCSVQSFFKVWNGGLGLFLVELVLLCAFVGIQWRQYQVGYSMGWRFAEFFLPVVCRLLLVGYFLMLLCCPPSQTRVRWMTMFIYGIFTVTNISVMPTYLDMDSYYYGSYSSELWKTWVLIIMSVARVVLGLSGMVAIATGASEEVKDGAVEGYSRGQMNRDNNNNNNNNNNN